MKIEKALKLFSKLESDSFTQNLIAQSWAKNILIEAEEPKENFPHFNEELESQINIIALSYLNIACSLATSKEHGNVSVDAFEKAGNILSFVHFPYGGRVEKSNYYLLLSSLAFYLSSQYSKSYIVVKRAEESSKFIRLISLFLKKDFKNLLLEINSVIFNPNCSDAGLIKLEDELEANSKIYTVILAKALNLVLEFVYSGRNDRLNLAREFLNDLKILTKINEDPAAWWISRLLVLLLDTFRQFSLWSILPPLINSQKTFAYIQHLAFNSPSIVELFYSQVGAIQAMAKDENIVISLPTSSGKTRIAEIFMLNTLSQSPSYKVLYLAPFRSLSYEIEESMAKVFGSLGFVSTLLYGGGQYSKIDRSLIENSNIIIATPEKAKAIIRADEGIADLIKLLVIDEGHLLGADQRLTQIELFIEELKFHITKNAGKILLLSAVLPNAKEISSWISQREDNVFESKRRLADQRFGLLKWSKKQEVNVEWLGKPRSYNKNFVEKFLPPNARTKFFPNDKNEAFAAAALKFSKMGTVLIFIAQARYILPNAKRVLAAMGNNKSKISWKNQNLVNALRLACEEAGEEELYCLAEYGILCHHGKLPSEIRILIEKIMREEKPRIIVSTSTLGQGVNIRISTVIFVDVYMNHQDELKIDSKDFWNIAGRAGRAFVDIEGKVLYGLDENHWNYNSQLKLGYSYFDVSNMNRAQSGLLFVLSTIKRISIECGVSFDLLLQLISENDFSCFKTSNSDYSLELSEYFNWMDDTLLALNYKFKSHADLDICSWIDEHFKKSLAYLQAEKETEINISGEDVLKFLKARNRAVTAMAGEPRQWESFVKSGIPLSSSLLIEKNVQRIKEIAKTYYESERKIEDTITVMELIETIVGDLPSSSFKHNFNAEEVSFVRQKWIGGAPLSEIKELENGPRICVEYFGMTLPWAINAIVRKLHELNLKEEAELFENIALFSEIGLPNLFAVKIYLSGIRSRFAAFELSRILKKELKDCSKKRLFKLITDNKELLQKHCTKRTSEWVEVFYQSQNGQIVHEVPRIQNFKFSNPSEILEKDILTARQFEGQIYLCSPDLKTKISVQSTANLPFDKVANDMGIYFEFDHSWVLNKRNPAYFDD